MKTLSNVVLLVSLVYQMTLAMSLSIQDCAVVGCGVLGTSLCKQMLASPEFSDCKGRFYFIFTMLFCWVLSKMCHDQADFSIAPSWMCVFG